MVFNFVKKMANTESMKESFIISSDNKNMNELEKKFRIKQTESIESKF